jgi:hypothetical protein
MNMIVKTASSFGLTTQLWAMIFAACGALLHPLPASAAPVVVGLWRFDEGTGTNVSDSSGLGNNGTLMGQNGNAPAWVITNQSGFTNALCFTNDGVNYPYVSIPGSPSLMIGETATNAWTITAWAYESSDGTGYFVASYGRILAMDGGNTFQLESGAAGDAEMYTWSEVGIPWQIGWGVGTSVTPILDQWVHWAAVYDGTNLTVYRNGNTGSNGGVSSVTLSWPLAFPGYAGAVVIGSELDQPASATWNGMLADVAVFAGALTQSEITNVMAGDFSAFIVAPPGIVGQPQNQTEPPGSTATFSVGADGQAPFQYQWYFNGTNELSSAGNPTATNATLVLTNLQFSQSGAYSVVVSNTSGAITSQPALLLVYDAAQTTLVGLWRFNETNGTTVLDSSGLGNNGTMTGENGNVPARVAGQAGFGGALRFTNDGTDHAYVTIPDNDSLMIGQTATNAWTITAWAYEDSDGTGDFVATYGRIMVIDDGTAFQLESGADNNGVIDDEMYTWSRANMPWQVYWGTVTPLSGSVAPLLDQWVHWAVVYDGTNLTLYRNGNTGTNGGVAFQPATAPLGGYFGFQDGILIGSEMAQYGNRNWNGMLDDVAVFNIALSQAQIQTVMAGDFSAFVPRPPLSASGSSGNIVLSWPAAQATFQLQSTPSLAPASWAGVTNVPAPNGSTLTVTLPAGTGTQFFRLVGP